MADYQDDKSKEINDLLGSSDNEETAMEETKQAPRQELDDLLGNSDDDSALAEENNDNNKTREYQNEVDDLLGGSDDEDVVVEALNVDGSIEIGKAVDVAEEPADDLHFLGKAQSNAKNGADAKQTTSSRLNLPETFRIGDRQDAYFMRTPNFIKLDRNAFDAASHVPDVHHNDATANIRWRYKVDETTGEMLYDTNGKPEMESNARFVKWTDGTLQLVIGDQVFDSRVLPTENCYAFASQKSITTSAENGASSSTKEDVCFECIGSITNRLILQPAIQTSNSSNNIDSRASQNVYSQNISQKYKKVDKIAVRDYESYTENPDKTLADLAKREEIEMRKEQRLKESGRQYAARAGGSSSSSSSFHNQLDSRRPKMSEGYLNQDDGNFDGENLRSLKSSVKHQPRKASRRNYDDIDLEAESEGDDDEDDNEFENDGFIASDDEEEEEEEDDESVHSDEEEDDLADEDEDEDTGSGSDDAKDEDKKSKKSKKSKSFSKKLSKKEKKAVKQNTKSKTEKKKRKDVAADSGGTEKDEKTAKKQRNLNSTNDTEELGSTASAASTTIGGREIGVEDEDAERLREQMVQEQRKLMQSKRNQRTLADSDDE